LQLPYREFRVVNANYKFVYIFASLKSPNPNQMRLSFPFGVYRYSAVPSNLYRTTRGTKHT
jgi:hypothetical protein